MTLTGIFNYEKRGGNAMAIKIKTKAFNQKTLKIFNLSEGNSKFYVFNIFGIGLFIYA